MDNQTKKSKLNIHMRSQLQVGWQKVYTTNQNGQVLFELMIISMILIALLLVVEIMFIKTKERQSLNSLSKEIRYDVR